MNASDQLLIAVVIQHIIIMQYPVVLMLGILSLQAYQVFRERAFAFIAFGWFFNLAYLLVRNYPYINTLIIGNRESALSDLATPLVFVSSLSFLLAARTYPRPTRNLLLLRGISDRTVVASFVLALLFVLISTGSLPSPREYPLLLIPGIPDVAVDVLAISALAIFFRHFSIERSLSGATNKSLYYGTLLYAAIQPMHFFTVGTQRSIATGAEAIGFLLGLASKMIILFGLLRLFSDAAIKARQEQARVEETRRTVGRIAHELGTPIAQMNIHVDFLLEESSLRGKSYQSLLNIDYALHRIEAIMEASRELHMLEEFMRRPNLRPTTSDRIERVHSINKLVQTALMAVKDTRDETVIYSIRYSGNCCLLCVSFEIIQIMINILRNALDALPTGEGRIAVETNNIENEGGHYIQVLVQDSGEGISPNIEAHLFDEGFSTRSGPGRGYGLFLTKRLVELNRGNVTISNIQNPKGGGNLGSRVVLEFPRVPCKKKRA